jgi:hypothetical protein
MGYTTHEVKKFHPQLHRVLSCRLAPLEVLESLWDFDCGENFNAFPIVNNKLDTCALKFNLEKSFYAT